MWSSPIETEPDLFPGEMVCFLCSAPHKEPHCSSPPYPTLTLLLWFWVTWLTGAQASGGVCLFKLFCLTEGQEYVCTLLLLSCPFHPAVPSPMVHTLVLKCDSDTNCLLMSSSPPISPLYGRADEDQFSTLFSGGFLFERGMENLGAMKNDKIINCKLCNMIMKESPIYHEIHYL